MLVNTGLIGTGLYVGLLAFSVTKFVKKGKIHVVYYLFAISVFGYFIHNMVSFAQILNLPFLFLVLGMGNVKTGNIESLTYQDLHKSG